MAAAPVGRPPIISYFPPAGVMRCSRAAQAGVAVLKDLGCGTLRPAHAGRRVRLAGWVHRRRDHGGLIFLDLRDVSGIVQLVVDPTAAAAAHRVAERVRSEYVVAAEGVVRRRPAGTENATLATGEVELAATALAIVNPSATPPFYVSEDVEVDEALRLRYRYLDLRRPRMQHNLILRHRVTKRIRDFLDTEGFLEIETPLLVQYSPGGARDLLVPSRLHPGTFYALPQSPQQLKQILMVAGYERYFQIARCFRDEDFRADRQLEFTQLDIEMGFVEPEDVLQISERLLIDLVGAIGEGLRIASVPFPRLTYQEAIDRFGSDKPDLRFGMQLSDVSHLVSGTEFNVFRSAVAAGGVVKGLAVPGGAELSRREIDALAELAREFGARGLAWIALGGRGGQVTRLEDLADDEIRSPIARFVPRPVLDEIAVTLGAAPGDLMVFVADRREVACEVLGRLRTRLGGQLGLADPDTLAFCWIYDFPLFEWHEEAGRWGPMHHMFTAPLDEDLPDLLKDPARVRAKAYDIVCNGVELGGGSVRIHERRLQQKVFEVLGYSEEVVRNQFGALLDAFEFGAPPHGGIAWGLDRLVMLLCRAENIREVIAFPKTAAGSDLMLGAPGPVPRAALDEVHIALKPPT